MKKLILILILGISSIFAEEKKSFIQEHRPTYIAFGDNKMNTVLQFSFKYEMVDKSNLYLGYTQFSVWHLWQESSPFKDHNFNPELFYRMPYLEKHGFSLDAGYEHKSNGREAGGSDRTYDSPYLFVAQQMDAGPFKLGINAKGYYIIRTFSNPGIVDYLGYGKFGVTLGFDVPFLEYEQFYLNYIPGTSAGFQKATFEAGTKFKTPFGADFAPYIFIQYWNGYLPSLLDFDVYSNGFRAGIIFYR